jgi:hypothetical protein
MSIQTQNKQKLFASVCAASAPVTPSTYEQAGIPVKMLPEQQQCVQRKLETAACHADLWQLSYRLRQSGRTWKKET